MKVRAVLRVLTVALCLWALMASQCPGTPSTIVFTFVMDPDGGTTGQVPVETYEVVLSYGRAGETGSVVDYGQSESFVVDAGVEYEKELPCVVYEAGDYEYVAQAYARHDGRSYIAATANGEVYTAARGTMMWAVRFPTRDAHIVVEVGDEDPAALMYLFTITDEEQACDLATSPAIDYDEDPVSWDFLVPSGAYSYIARSYSAAFPDCQDEDLSRMIRGPVSVETSQTETIVVNFVASLLLPPTGVSAEYVAPASIRISWNPVEGAESYNLYWSNEWNFTKESGTKIGGVTSSPYIHAPDPFSHGSVYYYIVTAVRGAEESAESEKAGAETS